MSPLQASEAIPSDLQQWQDKAKKEGVFSKYIHEVEHLFSGSKVTVEQNLAFRVLWTEHGLKDNQRSLKHELVDRYVTEAAKYLKGNKSWTSYCGALVRGVPQEVKDIGMFTVLMDWHKNILRLPLENDIDNVKYQSTP